MLYAEVSMNGSTNLLLSPYFKNVKREIYKFKKQNNFFCFVFHKRNVTFSLMG